MKRSGDRILTTHTGSLPRPDDLLELRDVLRTSLIDVARREIASQLAHGSYLEDERDDEPLGRIARAGSFGLGGGHRQASLDDLERDELAVAGGHHLEEGPERLGDAPVLADHLAHGE